MNEENDSDLGSNIDISANIDFPSQSIISIAVSDENASDTMAGERPESTTVAPDTSSENIVTEVKAGRSWRFGVVSVLVFMGWGAIVTRLIQLQGAQQQQLMNDRVTRQSVFSEAIPARPGEILDRNGQVLAMTIPCDSLFAVPEEIENRMGICVAGWSHTESQRR